MNQENQNIEWKESWHDDYLKWICGFANAQGGKMYCYRNTPQYLTIQPLLIPFLEQV